MYILIKTREYAKTNCHTCDHDGHKTTKSIYYNYEYTYAYALGNDFRVYYFCYHIVQRNAYFCLAIFTFENNFCIFIQKRSALVTTTPINLHFIVKTTECIIERLLQDSTYDCDQYGCSFRIFWIGIIQFSLQLVVKGCVFLHS